MTSDSLPSHAAPLLGVNVDHVATLRNARGGDFPDPLHLAACAVLGGAHIITFHLREDRRHMRDADVARLRARFSGQDGKSHVPLNFEAAATAEMHDIILRTRPEHVCLVPEKRNEVTTEGGLDVAAQLPQLKPFCAALTDAGIRVSLFIDPDLPQVQAAQAAGAAVVELHTGAYANAPDASARQTQWQRVANAAQYARKLGLQVNAGHGLNLSNVAAIAAIPGLQELHIGHALIGHALEVGMTQAVQDFVRAMRGR